MKWVQKNGEYFLYDMNNQCIAEFCISKNNKLAMYVIHLNNRSGEIPISDKTKIERIEQWVEDKVEEYLNGIIAHYNTILTELKGY